MNLGLRMGNEFMSMINGIDIYIAWWFCSHGLALNLDWGQAGIGLVCHRAGHC